MPPLQLLTGTLRSLPLCAQTLVMALYGLLPALPTQAAEIIPPTTDPELSPTEPDRKGTVITPEGYRLVWSDEFNTKGKRRPNTKFWTPENGFTRNQEMQWYQIKNAYVTGGRLVIEGRKEKFRNPNYEEGSQDWKKNRRYVEYTSCSLTTHNKFSAQYGIFEARVRFNPTTGMWPAFWTLGIKETWPSCGEIDILEYYREKYLTNLCWGTAQKWVGNWSSQTKALSECLKKDPQWAKKFHTFRLVWDETYARIYIDDELINETNITSTHNGRYDEVKNPFHQPHYIILNLALGANGGSLEDLKFPARYEVDFVRVFQKTDCPKSTYSIGTPRSSSASDHD